MEDEIDDKVLYQTYVSHMKLMSRFAWSVPLNINISPISFLVYLWRITKMYVLKPEILIIGTILVVLLMYLQAVDLWSHALLGRIQHTISRTARANVHRLGTFNSVDSKKPSWQSKSGPIAAFAVQGRRPKMEDRFVINENVSNTGVRFLAIFDGHGGEFAANYAKDKLVPNLYQKIIAIKNICNGNTPFDDINCNQANDDKPKSPNLHERKKIQKISSVTDECAKGSREITDLELLSKLENLTRPITREVRSTQVAIIKHIPVCSYIDSGGKINYGKLLTDEVLVADQMLLEVAKKNLDVAGTTALIAVLEESKLFVANVGDSRGVMCDNRGNAIPLSFDHKPHQMRERKRIKEAGGFVTFNGVWRVAGILATSRALGDYPLKDKRFVIADPDILTFNLEDHKPLFIILASDGLWDTFTNEEAVAFIRERLNESDFGAKSITLEAYYRGSLDNITVVVINFQNFDFNLTDSS
ncbi:hypothetical protein RN001_008146 [Aquatica leii]|uniref:PPM-type phosphatase domain-containing protein n=1 Tax=Aquatica leii TaxID=1421715 RepID=A0AAN7P3V7_9COLE|nr:hypothetical protein RN001_008146 [Aquatica leii]